MSRLDLGVGDSRRPGDPAAVCKFECPLVAHHTCRKAIGSGDESQAVCPLVNINAEPSEIKLPISLVNEGLGFVFDWVELHLECLGASAEQIHQCGLGGLGRERSLRAAWDDHT